MKHSELVAFLKAAKETADDNTALAGMELYAEWSATDSYSIGERRRYTADGETHLYRCRQAHTGQADWTPDINTSLWEIVNATHAGTLEDPIPAAVNMNYEYGKYYIEDGVIYLMNRQGMSEGESITLAYLPSQLVGQYFEVAA